MPLKSFQFQQETGEMAPYFQEIQKLRRDLSREEEKELTERFQRGDIGARNELVESNLLFVAQVAISYLGKGLPLSDLISEGNKGLFKAAERFDTSIGTRFISYAVWWIRQSIQKALAEQVPPVKPPLSRWTLSSKIKKIKAANSQRERELTLEEIAKKLDKRTKYVSDTIQRSQYPLCLDAPVSEDIEISLSNFIPDETKSAEEMLIEQDRRETIAKMLTELSPREAGVLRRYYGLNGDAATLEEIGADLGITRERVRQIRNNALRRMRHKTRRAVLKELL